MTDGPSRPAPVALFAFNRPAHLARTVASLKANPEAADTDLFVFCDGARGPEDAAAVAAVRAQVDALTGFASVTRAYQPANRGLAASIISGVTEVLARHEAVVVLEDDLVLSPHFLAFLNDGLRLYAGDAEVASVHGYCYPTATPLPETFFLKGADCWGWGTWRRGWSLFRADALGLLAELRARGLEQAFNLDGAYPYTRMLEQQAAGRKDSWAIRWHASCFLADKLTLYPGRSLVTNIGNDDSGTHAARTDAYAPHLAEGPVPVRRQPLVPSPEARAAFASFLRAQRGWGARAARLLGSLGGRSR